VLAGTSATKIHSRNDNFCVRKSVERVRFVATVGIFSFVVKRKFAEPVKAHAFQKAGGNDSVGVDVVAMNNGGNTSDRFDFFESHFGIFCKKLNLVGDVLKTVFDGFDSTLDGVGHFRDFFPRGDATVFKIFVEKNGGNARDGDDNCDKN